MVWVYNNKTLDLRNTHTAIPVRNVSFPGSCETRTGLGEPIPVSQLPGRGILRNYSNKPTN